jgi:hypothetical protein
LYKENKMDDSFGSGKSRDGFEGEQTREQAVGGNGGVVMHRTQGVDAVALLEVTDNNEIGKGVGYNNEPRGVLDGRDESGCSEEDDHVESAASHDSPWLSFSSYLGQTMYGRESITSGREGMIESLAGPNNSTDNGTESHEDSDTDSNNSDAEKHSNRRRSLMINRDCGFEASMLTGSNTRGRREMSMLLAVPGLSVSKAPMLPTKDAGALLAALYEPLIEIPVGLMARSLDNPTNLRPVEGGIGVGRLSLFLLPDDSLSLVYQGKYTPKEDKVDSNGPGVALLQIHTQGFFEQIRNVEQKSLEIEVWEELARFPVFREGSDPVITIHMLKGDKSGRSFYVLPGSGTEPPRYNNPNSGFESRIYNSPNMQHRFYFWLTDVDLEESICNLGRLKSWIKKPPTLAKKTGVSESMLEKVGEWLGKLDAFALSQLKKSGNASPIDGLPSSLEKLGAVLGKRVPSGSYRTTHHPEGRLTTTAKVSVNAAGLFRDTKMDLCFPCHLNITSTIVLRCDIRYPELSGASEIAEKEMSLVASTEAQRSTERIAKELVELVGQCRMTNLICEHIIHKVREDRIRLKNERQRVREMERRKKALEDTRPLIQKAVKALKDSNAKSQSPPALDNGEITSSSIDEKGLKISSKAISVSQLEGVMRDIKTPNNKSPSSIVDGSKKISIHDLERFFGNKHV